MSARAQPGSDRALRAPGLPGLSGRAWAFLPNSRLELCSRCRLRLVEKCRLQSGMHTLPLSAFCLLHSAFCLRFHPRPLSAHHLADLVRAQIDYNHSRSARLRKWSAAHSTQPKCYEAFVFVLRCSANQRPVRGRPPWPHGERPPESEAEVADMAEPKIGFAFMLDPEAKFRATVGVTSVPYVMLVDPQGVVRYQGHPAAITEKQVEGILPKAAE